MRIYDDRPGSMYPEVIGNINELTLAAEFGWSLPEIRALSIVDYGKALAFIRGKNKAQAKSQDVTIVDD